MEKGPQDVNKLNMGVTTHALMCHMLSCYKIALVGWRGG